MQTYPKSHPNSRIHGHSYEGEALLEGTVNEATGCVRPLEEIEPIVREVVSELDHGMLNEVAGLLHPTGEYLAKWIFDRLQKGIPELVEVRVHRPTVGISVSYAPEKK